MNEGGVDHTFRGGRSIAQAVEILERAPPRKPSARSRSSRLSTWALYVGSRRGKGGGGSIRASEAENLMSSGGQLFDNGGADESTRAGNEDTHKEILQVETPAPIGSWSVRIQYRRYRASRKGELEG
jgi:hypothetical protein